MENLKSLVQCSQLGSSKALEILLHSFKPLFLSFSRQPRYALIREDVLNICYCDAVKIIKTAGTAECSHFPGYMKKCLTHTLNNAARKAERNAFREGTSLDNVEYLPHLVVNNEDKMLNRLALKDGWRKLSPDEQKILHMYFFQSLNQEAIGKVLGIKQGTVAKELAKALQKLRNLCR